MAFEDVATAPECERVRILVDSRTHDADLRSLGALLANSGGFPWQVRFLGEDAEGGSFDLLSAAVEITVSHEYFDEAMTLLAASVTLWHVEHAVNNLQRDDFLSPALVTVVSADGAATTSEGD